MPRPPRARNTNLAGAAQQGAGWTYDPRSQCSVFTGLGFDHLARSPTRSSKLSGLPFDASCTYNVAAVAGQRPPNPLWTTSTKTSSEAHITSLKNERDGLVTSRSVLIAQESLEFILTSDSSPSNNDASGRASTIAASCIASALHIDSILRMRQAARSKEKLSLTYGARL